MKNIVSAVGSFFLMVGSVSASNLNWALSKKGIKIELKNIKATDLKKDQVMMNCGVKDCTMLQPQSKAKK